MKNLYNKFKDWFKGETILDSAFFKLTVTNNIVFFITLSAIVKLLWFIVDILN